MTLVGAAFWLAVAEGGPDAAPTDYTVTRYTAEQDLPQNSVRALLQTRDGYLWVGTLAGLARFDGVKFKVFNSSNTPELPNDAITALAEDRRDGSLWINAGKGLLRYHGHRFERFDEEQGIPQPFGGLWPAHGGGLWYSPHPGQLVVLQDKSVRTWQLRPRRASENGDEIPGHRILRVEEEEGGSLLVLMPIGLFRFVPETGVSSLLSPIGMSDSYYRSVARQDQGIVLLAARDGLWRLSTRPQTVATAAATPDGQRAGAEWENLERVAPDDQQCPALLCPSRDGGLWVVWSVEGPPRVARFRAGRSEFLDLSELLDCPVFAFCEDHEGHLWLGTELGLYQLRPKTVQVYASAQGLRNDFVRTLAEGPDGTIWAGTAQGVSGIKEGRVTNLPAPQPPQNWGWAEGLLADRRGRVWYGEFRNTVAVFDQGVWVSQASLSLGESWVRTLYEDRQGRIWAGFDQGVLWLDETGAVRQLPHSLSHPDVRVIYQDRRGDMWFGTYGGGLNRLRDGHITTYTTTLGEHNNRAWWIHEDTEGVFWVGSRHGLNRFVPPDVDASPRTGAAGEKEADGTSERAAGRFFTFTTRHGLHENVVNSIQEDDFGFLWLSGLQGIYRVARRELNAVAAGRQAQALAIAFGEADGMLNSQCNGGVNQPSSCKDRSGRIWFPTARGVAVVDPRAVRRNAVPPTVVIEQVVADDEVVYGDGRHSGVGAPTAETGRNAECPPPTARLQPGRARVIEIRYTATSFARPKGMRFKYQLEGHDRDWRFDDDNARVAFYTDLRPGAYTFRVTGCNNHGVWSETPAVFAFTLAPHFWQTWLFYLLASATGIGLTAAIQAYRLRWQRRLLKAEHQNAFADERARIARDLHDDLGTALTGLALQLDVLRRETGDGAARSDRLAEAAARIRALAERLRQVVWAVNPRCDTVSSLASFLEQQTGQFLTADGLRCRLEFPADIPPLPLNGEARYELAMGVREALANAIRHSHATELVLGLSVQADHLIVRVADNGRGFPVAQGMAHGRGLTNIQERLKKIGGHCECRSTAGAGTTVALRVPLRGAPIHRGPLAS